MSKIGKTIVKIPLGTEVTFEKDLIKVKGPKGALEKRMPSDVKVEIKDSTVSVVVVKTDKATRSLHGTWRSLIANMVKGVTEGWSVQMELVGTGYRAEVQGNTLVLTVGYIQPVRVEAPTGITFKVEKNLITIDGIDRESVGEMAAKIRAVRPPEPYQGKGIKYKEEVIKKKPGKAAKAGEAA